MLDASITVAWLNKAESTPIVLSVFRRLETEVAWVPSLWWVEVANALQMGFRRKRYSMAERDGQFSDVARLTIFTDTHSFQTVPEAALALSDRHTLTVYDAVYLELALRRGLPLATLDSELREAAMAEGVALLGA